MYPPSYEDTPTMIKQTFQKKIRELICTGEKFYILITWINNVKFSN